MSIKKSVNPKNVYMYLSLNSNSHCMYSWNSSIFAKYCEGRKSLRVAGSFVDYYDNDDININDRIMLNKMLTVIQE